MERLTEKQSAGYDLKDLNGQYCNNYCDEQSSATCRDCAIYQAIQNLARYEDMEESLEKVYGECNGLLETAVSHLAKHKDLDIRDPAKSVLLTDEDVEKWKKWKEAEEQDKMLILPCKPGDTVYVIEDECEFNGDCHQSRTCKSCEYRNLYVDKITATLKFIIGNIDRFGKTVFLTEPEAEKALEGMKNE